MNMSTISIRVNSEDKNRFETFCNNTGMNISTAINMFIKAVLMKGAIPFEIKDEIPISRNIPNKITAESIAEGDRLINEPNQEEFTNIDEMRKSLGL